jgi:hypothetical protein
MEGSGSVQTITNQDPRGKNYRIWNTGLKGPCRLEAFKTIVIVAKKPKKLD